MVCDVVVVCGFVVEILESEACSDAKESESQRRCGRAVRSNNADPIARPSIPAH